MNKIILYNPKPNKDLKSKDIPLALLFISKMLALGNYDIKIFSDLDDKDSIVEECKDAICVGITAMTGYQITDGLRIGYKIKNIYPHLPVVWGGWHCSLLPDETLQDENVDIVVRGQGERTFYELVKRLQEHQQLSGLSGISYKQEGKIYHNQERTFESLDNFPPIPYHLVNVERYLFPTEFGDRTVNYVSSYGCPYNCGFCCQHTVTKSRWYSLSSNRVVDDMERLANEYGVNGISINDSNFFVDENRTRQICEGIIQRKIKAKWGNANGRIDTLLRYTDQAWELIKRSGCYSILTGSESGSQEVLNLIQKDAKVEDNFIFAKKSSRYRIKVIFSNLAGLPWPNRTSEEIHSKVDASIHLTLKDIKRCLSLDSRHRALLFIYTPYPGTPLYQDAVNLGFKPPQTFKGWGNFTLYTRVTPWITEKQANFITMLSTYIFLFLDSDFKKWITNPIKNRFKKLLADILVRGFSLVTRLRWRYNFFAWPLDYYFYRLIRKIQKEL